MSEKDFYLYFDGKPVKVSEAVYKAFYHGERKERYFMEDLKVEDCSIDPQAQTVTVIPSREDSYERLLEAHKQFATSEEPLEEQVVRSMLLENALHTLSSEEQELIRELYFLDKTEREMCARFQVSQNTIHYRKEQALKKMRKLLKNNF